MDDEQILVVTAQVLSEVEGEDFTVDDAADVLAALRDAGLEVVPSDIAKLGHQAVEALAAVGLEGHDVATLVKHHRANAGLAATVETMGTDEYRLGRAVASSKVPDDWQRAIYADAGVPRP